MSQSLVVLSPRGSYEFVLLGISHTQSPGHLRLLEFFDIENDVMQHKDSTTI
jgi:hypothetical protein